MFRKGRNHRRTRRVYAAFDTAIPCRRLSKEATPTDGRTQRLFYRPLPVTVAVNLHHLGPDSISLASTEDPEGPSGEDRGQVDDLSVETDCS